MNHMPGYIIAEIETQIGKFEKWAYKRHPEMYPYDYTWFLEIPIEERHKHGVLIE